MKKLPLADKFITSYIALQENYSMDKMIVSMGVTLIALGVGFWVAFQLILGLHSAYITGGVMWMALGIITIGVGLKKTERLNALPQKIPLSKNALSH